MFKQLALACLSFAAARTGIAMPLLGKEPYRVDGKMHVYRDFAYGSRPDQPGEGKTHRSGQLFDVYLPDKPGKVPADAPVLLYLHGGSWCMRWDKDAEGYQLFKLLAAKGFVICSMDYMLQNDIISDEKQTCRPHATFADMLRDIDLAVTHLKTFLPSIGITPRKLAIGGGSAGAHLSALYACDQANPSALGLNLGHDIPIAFELDIIGPVNLLSEGLRKATVESTKKGVADGKPPTDTVGRFVTLLGWLAGEDVHAAYRAGGESAVAAILRRWSPLALVTPQTPPFILAYNRLHPFSGTDGLVETSNCTDMEEALGKVGVESASRFCWFRFHGTFTDWQLDWIADTCADFARRWQSP